MGPGTYFEQRWVPDALFRYVSSSDQQRQPNLTIDFRLRVYRKTMWVQYDKEVRAQVHAHRAHSTVPHAVDTREVEMEMKQDRDHIRTSQAYMTRFMRGGFRSLSLPAHGMGIAAMRPILSALSTDDSSFRGLIDIVFAGQHLEGGKAFLVRRVLFCVGVSHNADQRIISRLAMICTSLREVDLSRQGRELSPDRRRQNSSGLLADLVNAFHDNTALYKVNLDDMGLALDGPNETALLAKLITCVRRVMRCYRI
jgi:hypothetical protein